MAQQAGTAHLHTADAIPEQDRAWTGPACGQCPRGPRVSMDLSLAILSVVLLWPSPAQRAVCGPDRASCSACSSRDGSCWHTEAEAPRSMHSAWLSHDNIQQASQSSITQRGFSPYRFRPHSSTICLSSSKNHNRFMASRICFARLSTSGLTVCPILPLSMASLRRFDTDAGFGIYAVKTSFKGPFRGHNGLCGKSSASSVLSLAACAALLYALPVLVCLARCCAVGTAESSNCMPYLHVFSHIALQQPQHRGRHV